MQPLVPINIRNIEEWSNLGLVESLNIGHSRGLVCSSSDAVVLSIEYSPGHLKSQVISSPLGKGGKTLMLKFLYYLHFNFYQS